MKAKLEIDGASLTVETDAHGDVALSIDDAEPVHLSATTAELLAAILLRAAEEVTPDA